VANAPAYEHWPKPPLALVRPVRYSYRVRFYALHDHEIEELYLWSLTRDEVEQHRVRMVRDEPEWRDKLEVVLVDSAAPRSGSPS
jgi:hypothetical protein